MLHQALDELGVTSPKRALDIGTGTGQAVFTLAERYPACELVAVDASPHMITAARAKPGADRVDFRVADGGRLPFAAGAFDLCVSLLVQPFENESYRVLAAGGWALYCYPAGGQTPIWFPSSLLRPRLRRAGFTDIRSGSIGVGQWTAGRREAAADD
jgi:SAM-dependent methyltransferase